MANTIPCPNPTCAHSFALAEVQAAAQLLCPKCGFRMQGKGKTAPTPPAPTPTPPAPTPTPPAPTPKPALKPAAVKPPAKPAPKPAAPPAPPLAKPAPPLAVGAAPLATPVVAGDDGGGSLPEGDFFNPGLAAGAGPLVRTGAPRKKTTWMRVLVIALAVGFAACIVIIAIGVIVWLFPDALRNFGQPRGDAIIVKVRNAKNENENALKLVLPRSEWSIDPEIKNSFGAQTAWSNNEYKGEFWFALIVKDYGMHRPRDAEMVEFCTDKLEGHFGNEIELGAKVEPAKFGTLPAQKLLFRGVVKEAKWVGECYMFFNNGLAYWLFLASPEADVLEFFEGELPEKHIFVISERRGWREQPAPTEAFATSDAKFQMTAPKGVWEGSNDPKSEDPTGVMLLAGKYRREKDNRKNARLLVFSLKKEADLKAAVKAVRDHLDARFKEGNENAKVVHAPDVVPGQTEIGTLEDVGNKRGRVVDLKLMFQDEPQEYMLLSVVNEPDGCHAFLCSCDWKARQIWRQDFLDVLRTVKMK
jgi:hypothetical protein